MFALVVGVSLSAFTNHKTIAKPKHTTTEYYFFEVVNGQIDPNSPLNETPLTIEEFESNNPVSCPSGDNADCVRAWETGHTPTATGADDFTIRKL